MKRTLHLTVVMLLVLIASVNRAYGQEESDSVTVHSIAEVLAMPIGTPFTLLMDTLYCEGGSCCNYWFVHDKTGHIVLDNPTFLSQPIWGIGHRKFYKNIIIKGHRNIEFEMPVIKDMTYYNYSDDNTIYGTYYSNEPVDTIDISEWGNHIGEYVYVVSDSILVMKLSANENERIVPDSVTKRPSILCGGLISYNDKPALMVQGAMNRFAVLYEDNYTDYSLFKSQGGQYNSARVIRSFKANKWYTLTLPASFNITTPEYKHLNPTLAVYVTSENGIVEFKKKNWIGPGEPGLVKFPIDVDYLDMWVAIDKTPKRINGGDYNFVGTLWPVQPQEGCLYLSDNNTIRPLSPGGTIKSFRAYFEPATPNAARARAISIDGETTAIEDIEWGDGNPFIAPTDNRIYNLEGQMVGTNLEQLPKGLYIVNGKKVIK